MPAASAAFGFRVAKTRSGWTWAAYDADGRAVETGAAPNRAAAAACVIRVIARNQAAAEDAASQAGAS